MKPREQVHVFDTQDRKILSSVPLPAVFTTPIRDDVVRFVHTNIAKNARQAYAISRHQGHRTTAESWGTGRAVARIPRVAGGGTNRSGQGAYGNMCRGGRMFGATKTFRRWHRHVNKKQRRLAVCSALAASAVPALVLSRGHRIEGVPEVPFVVDDRIRSLKRTKEALTFLKLTSAIKDVEKVEATRRLRPTKGKWRNRRQVERKGPLLILHGTSRVRAFSNLRGIDLGFVDQLNLLDLAPGGHLGRFVIWTQSAFTRLDALFGTLTRESKTKKGWFLPRPLLTSRNLNEILSSPKIRAAIREAKSRKEAKPSCEGLRRRKGGRRLPKTRVRLEKLSPYARISRHNRKVEERRRQKKKEGGTLDMS